MKAYFVGAQVGDEVVCLLNGAGVIFGIANGSACPICVRFKSGSRGFYGKNGRLNSSDTNQ